jgi:hypothetical protein
MKKEIAMTRRSDGTNLVAIYHFISGFLSLLGLCLIVMVPMMMAFVVPVSGDEGGWIAVGTMAIIGLVGGGIFLLVSIANFVIGWGLWHLREWARVAAIALAFFRLINIPLGTVIGGLIIWHLLKEETKAEFAVG